MDWLTEFWQEQTSSNTALNFFINIAFTAVLSLILEVVYVKLGNSSTKSRLYANNFMLLSVTTALVITIIAVVESSVALSLGLLGVLSVVRFRAALQDPEELAYLFLAITIGLGAGLGQLLYTTIGFALVTVALGIRKMIYVRLETDRPKLNKGSVTVVGDRKLEVELEQMVALLQKYCDSVKLKSLNEREDGFEAQFRVTYYDVEKLTQAKDAVATLQEGMSASIRA